jgi:hypothetical protein
VNIYTQRFSALCARNKRRVEYVLRIESIKTIMVEDIQEIVEDFESGYHEDFADELYAKFGGVQTLDAHHHGTDVRTIRP